jgi:hypothetical protein
VAAGISAGADAVVFEAICDAGVGKVGLSACDFGFELHLAIATTMPSKPKKKRTRNLFMRFLFLRQHPHPNAHDSGYEHSQDACPRWEAKIIANPDIDMRDEPPDMSQTNQTEDEPSDTEPRFLRVHALLSLLESQIV